jgi:hypothetical protein
MITDINKRRYIKFHNGYWIVNIKNKSISRHKDINDAARARDKFLQEHPEIKLVYRDRLKK